MGREDGERSETPSNGAPPEGRRSRLRGVVLALLAVAASALVVVLAALAFLHTSLGATAARVSLERWLSLAAGGPVRIGRLEPRLWKGEVAADAVSLRLPGTSLDVGRVEGAWSPAGGLRLRLVRPAVVARDTGEPASAARAEGLAARPWRVLERLDTAEVVDGRVELRDAADAPWLVLEGVGATLSGPGDIEVRVASGAVGWPEGGLRVRPATAEAALALEAGALVVRSLRIASGTAAVDVSGRLERLSPATATATARVGFDGGLVAALAPEAEVEGRVEGDVSVEVVEDRVRGALDVASPALRVAGVGPWAARGHARIEGPQLVLDALAAEGFGGRLVAEGPLALDTTARTEARVRAEGIDVAALARALSGEDVPVAARADAALRWTTTGWDVEGARGDGEIALRPAGSSARAKVPGIPLAGSGRVRIEGLAVALEGARVEAHGAALEADAAISAAGVLSGTWRGRLPLRAVDALAADLGSEARLGEGHAGELLGAGDLGGTTAAPEATARLESEGLEVRGKRLAVEADARYAAGRLSLAPLVVRSGLGQATLAGSVPAAAGSGDWDMGGTIDTLDLAPLLALAGIEGSGPATGTLRIEGPTDRPRGRADLEARVELEGEAPGESIVAALAASSEGGRVAVERLSVAAAGGTIEGSGAYDVEDGSFEAKAEAAGLDWSRLPLVPPPARRLGGTLSGSLRLAGTAKAPSGEAALRLAGTTLDGAPLPDLAFDAQADGRRLDLAARSGDHGFLKGGGPLEGDWPMRLAIDVSALPAQALLDALPAAKDRGATVEARGSLAVDLPLRDPGAYRWTGEGLAARGRLPVLEWSTEPFRASGTAEEVRLDGLRLATRGRVRGGADRIDTEEDGPAPEGARTPASPGPAGGVLSVEGRVPLAEARTFDLAVKGDFTLAVLAAVAEDAQAGGNASLEARVEGTLDAPDVRGTFALSGGRFRVEDARLSALEVEGRFEGREALVDRASARLLGGRLLASGSLPLAPLEAGRTARLRLEARNVDLSRLAVPASERTEDSPSFRVSVEGVLEADAPRLAGLRGEGRFTKVESRSNEGTVGLASPARWTLVGGRFEQEPILLAGPLGTLEARFALDLDGAAKGSASLAGPFDLRLLSPFVPDTTLSGPARADLRAEWNGGAARVEGGLAVKGGRLTLDTLNFSASRIDGEVRFLGDRAELDATAESGDGRMVAYGGMSFGPSLLGPAAVSIEAERLPIAYPEGFRARASGALLVEGDAGRYRVSGLVDLTQAFYTAEFDARQGSLDRLDYQIAALRAAGSIADALPLAVDVRFRDPLRIRNSQAQLDVTGTITANGTLAQPAATGQLALIEGGRLTIRRARIRADEGRVELNGYPAGVPEVEFEGFTQVGGVTMVVRAQGSLDELQLDISSPNRPDLSQADLVALLLTGRTSTAAADQGAAILAEELAAALGGALQRSVGETFLIDVSSDESMLLDEGDPTQRFRIGTRVGRDLSVFYSTRLDGTEQRWVGQWNPRGGRFTFRAIDDQEEGLLVEASDRVSFNVFPGRERRRRTEARRVQVVSLRLEGELPLPEEELLRASGLRAGRRYDPLRLLESADRVRARLVEAGHRSAWVEVRETPAPGGENRVDLVLRVEAGPRIVLTWRGDDPGARLRRLALEAWPPHASVEAAAGSIARTVRIELQAEGHYEALVGHEAREDGARAEVELIVTRGPRGRGVDVVFEGHTRLSSEELSRTLPKAGSREFFEALDRPAQLVARARVAYAGLGHIRARVGPPRTRFDGATGRLEVRLPVREGPTARVAALVLPEGIAAPEDGGPRLRLREGEPFDVEAYLGDRDALAAWYRSEGFTEARVRGLLEPVGGDVHVTMLADTGEQWRLGEVRIASSGRTREALVRRSVRVEPGEVILPRQLAETRTRLADLGTFSSVDVRTVPAPGREGVRDIELSFVERPDIELEYGLRYDFSGSGGADSPPDGPTEGRLQAAAALRLANPLGWGWSFGAYTLQTGTRQNYRVAIGAPTLAGRRVKTQLLAFDETDDDAAIAASFASKVRGFSVQQSHTLLWDTGSRRWHERLRAQWGYTNKDIRYSESIGSDDIIAGNRAFLSLALIGDERDSLTDPRKGFFWTATTELSRRFLGSDVDYVRAYGQIFTYAPLPGGLVWAQGYRAGVVPGDDPFYLLENRFQAGGPTTVRGFRQNGLGPQLDEDEGLGGQAVFVLNQELRFPIWKNLKGGVFWDAGNSWLLASEFSVRDLRHTVGGGLRIMLPFGPIRLEYGFILDRRKNSDGSYVEPLGRFVFGLGHAF